MRNRLPSNSDRVKVAKCIQGLIKKGILFAGVGLYEEALKCAEDTVKMCKAKGRRHRSIAELTAHAFNNKGAALADMKRFKESLKWYDASLAVYADLARKRRTKYQRRSEATARVNKGYALAQLKCDAEAFACFEKAIDTFRTLETTEDYAIALYTCGEAHILAKRFQVSLPYYDQAITIWQGFVQRGGDRFEIEVGYALSSKADALGQLGKYAEALECADGSIAVFQRVLRIGESPKLKTALTHTRKLRGWIIDKMDEERSAGGEGRN